MDEVNDEAAVRRCRCRSGWTALLRVIKKDGKRENKESVDWTGLDWTGLDWTGLDWDNTGGSPTSFLGLLEERETNWGEETEVGKFLYLGRALDRASHPASPSLQ